MQGNRFIRTALCAALLAAGAAQAGNLTIESWRTDDKALWEDVLIPAFNKKYPDVKVKFAPTAPTEYDSSLQTRLTGGTAGDLITCRPFDKSLDLFKKGYLESLNGKPGMQNFPESAKVAWQTDDGKSSFCMPMGAVMHGFLYNKKIFTELGVQPPKTIDEFHKVLEAAKKAGKVPLALGTADQWEANQIVFTSIGAPYWKGEEGRKALIAGKAKFTDPQFVAAWDEMSKWGPYLAKGYSAQTYADTQNLFASGKAAVVAVGSWDISYYNQNAKFEYGAFPPPVPKAGDKCYISDHPDIGMGVNPKSKNKDDAYKFLTWLGSQEFADLYTNKVTGFYSLSNHLISVKDPVAKQMLDWRKSCASTIRLNAQIMNRGEPNMENELWNVNSQVLNGKMTPKDAATRIQTGFAKWYKPQQK
ncbi:ABC transporter substrate-binding protein [Jeongeupia naejangsanensis]|uniref:Probable sugar-binding periplasmic protein n=1 Tax=Jeongeupia naejangsanensis TaxID=613195 RepID=A0ABS2BQN2_9NEIS|nr:ABC transporter substrate-binding protein [Jeongeupia naejangsanensis]MBM3117079.1 carbohydrate ABC transporter substrate-binding protein [Jeongeupia naejangsanensis]